MAVVLNHRAGKPVARKTPELIAFGQRIRELRTARGLTQAGLGELADMHWVSINRIEAGAVDVPFTTVHRLAAALGVEPGELFPPPKGKRK